MKIIIVTQKEPFYLKDNIKYLLNIINKKIEIVGFIIGDLSVDGKKTSFLKKSINILKIFGLNFFLRYGFKFIYNMIFQESLESFLKSKKIKILNFKENLNHPNSLKLIKNLNPDLMVSILGNQIFKSEILKIPKFGFINLHSSLLPSYRGLMPTFWVLKNREKYTGVSVFFIDEGIDSGEIILQKKIKINQYIHANLIKITKKVGMEALAESIDMILYNNYTLIDNDDSKMSYYSYPSKDDVKSFLEGGNKFF